MPRLLLLLAALLAMHTPSEARGRVSGELPAIFTLPGEKAFVSPDKDLSRNQALASKELSRLSLNFEKCYAKAARDFSKGRTEIETRLEACLAVVQLRYEVRITALESRGPGLPECADYRALAVETSANMQALNATTYCASAAGAIIDGAILY